MLIDWYYRCLFLVRIVDRLFEWLLIPLGYFCPRYSLSYKGKLVTLDFHCAKCTFSTRVTYRGILSFTTGGLCSVRCWGITTCFLYICPLTILRKICSMQSVLIWLQNAGTTWHLTTCNYLTLYEVKYVNVLIILYTKWHITNYMYIYTYMQYCNNSKAIIWHNNSEHNRWISIYQSSLWEPSS